MLNLYQKIEINNILLNTYKQLLIKKMSAELRQESLPSQLSNTNTKKKYCYMSKTISKTVSKTMEFTNYSERYYLVDCPMCRKTTVFKDILDLKIFCDAVCKLCDKNYVNTMFHCKHAIRCTWCVLKKAQVYNEFIQEDMKDGNVINELKMLYDEHNFVDVTDTISVASFYIFLPELISNEKKILYFKKTKNTLDIFHKFGIYNDNIKYFFLNKINYTVATECILSTNDKQNFTQFLTLNILL